MRRERVKPVEASAAPDLEAAPPEVVRELKLLARRARARRARAHRRRLLPCPELGHSRPRLEAEGLKAVAGQESIAPEARRWKRLSWAGHGDVSPEARERAHPHHEA